MSSSLPSAMSLEPLAKMNPKKSIKRRLAMMLRELEEENEWNKLKANSPWIPIVQTVSPWSTSFCILFFTNSRIVRFSQTLHYTQQHEEDNVLFSATIRKESI
jgi:hypothetical protein